MGKFYDLKAEKASVDIWVAFGMGRNFSFISINKICNSVAESKSRSLTVFHALSGCETTSAFNGIKRQTFCLAGLGTMQELFCKHNRSIEKLPHTQNALLKHVERVTFQSGIWTTSDMQMQDIPSPERFGWHKIDNLRKPVCMTI